MKHFQLIYSFFSVNGLFCVEIIMSDSTGMIISSNSIQNSERKSSFFHCSPDHCSVSLAAINRMRKNNQVKNN